MLPLIQKLKISQISISEIGISWEVINPSQAFEFFVDRSGSSAGPWETLNSISIRQAYGYIDRSYNTESINRTIYYRVRGISEDKTILSEPIELHKEPSNYMGLAIAKNKKVLLERINGTKCYVFIRKTFGPKCTVCYDAARQKSIGSYCLSCFGTTFQGGYFDPILMYIYIEHLIKSNSKTDLQNLENLRIDGNWAGNFPLLSPGDLIISAKEQDIRYIIEPPIDRTAQNDAIVEQRFSVTQVHQSRVEMKVPVPLNVYSINDVNIYRRDYK